MHNFDVFSWIRQMLAPSNGLVLWISLSVLLFAVAFWAQRRSAAARARAERARREVELEQLGGDSFFMPLPAIEQAVEIANPVEIDSLLNGESETIAARARALLTAPTGVCTSDGTGDLPFVLGSAPPAAMAARPPQTISLAAPAAPVGVAKRAPAPILPLDVPPTIAIAMPKRAAIPPANAAAAPAAPPRAAAAPVPVAIPVATPLSVDESVPVSVRDLVLTWFEARGYRASAVSVQFRPIELQLRHRSDAGRNYAFVVERERVTGLRAGALLKLAKSAGHTRLLIAAEAGSDEAAARELRQVGVRIFDQALIRTELEKVDIRIAAKIIAVARGRDLARRSTPAATAAPARASARETAISAGA